MSEEIWKEVIKAKTAFVPRKTKADLALWIAEYLGLEFPDVMVDPDSTTTPMEYIWTVYNKALNNLEPERSRILAYASRDSFKTLGTAVIEFLMIVHLNRDVGHMAAIEKQARQATGYVEKFFNRPYFRPFVVGSNQRSKEFVRYEHKDTGESIPQKQWEALTPTEQSRYTRYGAKLDIVICTMAGANGLHVPFFVVDEVDLASPDAYEEAKMIPTSDENRSAITALTSTRKFAFGLVQDEIDKAPKTGLKILHWNILDIAKQCPASRHRPDLPKVPVYVDKGALRLYKEEEFQLMSSDQQEKCTPSMAFNGCLTNCSLYPMCGGRLATVQQPPKFKQAVNLQKPIEHLIAQFAAVSEPVANAQLLCRKPSQIGLIYPFLDRDVHVKKPYEIAEMVTGLPHPPTMAKEDLVALLKARETTRFVGGMDFGYTHNFVEVTAAVDGNRAFVLDCLSMPQILTNQQIELCQSKTSHYKAKIYADPENPQTIKEFRDAGFNMPKWTKGPGSVNAGIEVVRWMIRPLIGEPLLYFLEDPGVDHLVLRMSQYHWKVDAAGRPTDIPDDKDDDECDAIRYILLNEFSKTKAVQRKSDIDAKQQRTLQEQAAEIHRRQILEHVTDGDIASVFGGGKKSIKKGKFSFSMG